YSEPTEPAAVGHEPPGCSSTSPKSTDAAENLAAQGTRKPCRRRLLGAVDDPRDHYAGAHARARRRRAGRYRERVAPARVHYRQLPVDPVGPDPLLRGPDRVHARMARFRNGHLAGQRPE